MPDFDEKRRTRMTKMFFCRSNGVGKCQRPLSSTVAWCERPKVAGERATMMWSVPPNQGVPVMKTIASALIALAVLTGAAASANAFDTQSFYEQLDRSRQ
jgi:hypothetical protein